MQNVPYIITNIDPKEIRAKHNRILCHDGEFEITAYTEIVNEQYDPATGKYRLQIGLDYPRRSTRPTISLAVHHTQDGKMVALAPQKHWMNQEDFERMLKNEPVTVPIYN
jgi:hypothetical protein